MGEVDGVSREVLERMGSMLMVGGVRVELVGAWACRLRATLICCGVPHALPVSRCLSRPLPVAVSLTPSLCRGVSHALPLSRCLSRPPRVAVSHALSLLRCLDPRMAS